MKLPKSWLLLSLALTVLSIATTEGIACSCMETSSVCNAFGDAKAVFIGKVVEGSSVEFMSDMLNAGTRDLTFTFKVRRGFIGAKAGQTVVIHTGFGFGDCGFPFKKNEEYIVYAYQSEDNQVLSTGVCTRTTHISRADEDISGLEALFKSKGSSVTGKITRYERSSLLGEPNVPLANVTVKLVRARDGKPFFARSNSQGLFAFTGLGSGRYRLVPPVGNGWIVGAYDTAEFVLNDHGCANNDISIRNDSEINVKVLDPNDRPVQSLWVELIPTSINSSNERFPNEFHVTNPQGETTFSGSPPGKYTLSVNFFNPPNNKAPFPAVFAPGVEDRSRAQVFEIRPGTHVSKIIVLKIPRSLDPVSLPGIVVDQEGKPVKGAQVNLVDERAPGFCVNGCGETNERGEFTLTGYRGRRYSVEALLRDQTNNPSYRGTSDVFALDSDPKFLRIVVKRTNDK